MQSETKLSFKIRQLSENDFAPLDYFEIEILDRWVKKNWVHTPVEW